MLAVKAQFDGKRVLLPSMPSVHECPVIVIFEEEDGADRERESWMAAQESALSKVWMNEEDAVYDNL
ncbi:MAG: hypothetical protein R6V03_08585 [Kiritimatiellia bacterium]